MTAIAAAAMRCRTMADGSLRIEVEVEPNDAQAAFSLFGKPGAPVALAALLPGYVAAAKNMPDPDPDKLSPPPKEGPPKGGVLAQLAGRWCQEIRFTDWLQSEQGPLWDACEGSPPLRAAELIRRLCFVRSRAELDHDAHAATIFHHRIRLPYAEHLRSVS